MKQTYDYYSPELLGDECDLIEYSREGIETWKIWSDVMMDWVEVSPEKMKKLWPGKFEDLTSKLIVLALEAEDDSLKDQKYMEGANK